MIIPYNNPTEMAADQGRPGLGRGVASCVVGIGAAVLHVACIAGIFAMGRNGGDLGPALFVLVHYLIFALFAAIAVGGFLFYQGLNILLDAHQQAAVNRAGPAIFFWGVGVVAFLAVVVGTFVLPSLM